MSPRRAIGSALALVLGLAAMPAGAHQASDAFLALTVEGERVHGAWEIALRDLAATTDLDADGDRAITWGELRGAAPGLAQALPGFLAVESGAGPCAATLGDVQVSDRGAGRHAWLAVEARCDGAPLRLRYGFLFDLDPTHRALAVVTQAGATRSAVLSPDAAVLALAAGSARTRAFGDHLRAGAHHIWIGPDHILFLVTLLMPCVLVPLGRRWQPAGRLGPVAWDVVRVVTAFTVAHSATLGLTALGVLRLPGAWVEAAIAASVIVAALNNLRPHATRARSGMALAFGLVHGCGLASALGEAGLPREGRLLALAAFNVGVELGQLAIVAAVLPLAFLVRSTVLYRRAVVGGGSVAVAALGLLWLAERSGLLPEGLAP